METQIQIMDLTTQQGKERDEWRRQHQHTYITMSKTDSW